MKLKINRGTTSKLIKLYLQDSTSTTGGGLVGITSSSSGLTCYFIREGDSSTTAITLSAGTVGTWTSGGLVAVDSTNMPGVYEFGVPNIALSTGSSTLIMFKGATNMVNVLIEIELDAVNYQNSASFITGINGVSPPSNWSAFSIDSSGRVQLIPSQVIPQRYVP